MGSVRLRKAGGHVMCCLVFVICTGCGSMGRRSVPLHISIPPSHTTIAETALMLALDDSALPEVLNTEVVCQVGNGGSGAHFLRNRSFEFLMNRGYSVYDHRDGLPIITVYLDTLYVRLYPDRTDGGEKVICRHGEARISLVYSDNPGNRKVFTGRGISDDCFPIGMLKAAGDNESFVIYRPAYTVLKEKGEPIVIGTAMTLLLWLLYSYRG